MKFYRLIALLLAVLMAASAFAACTKDKVEDEDTNAAETTGGDISGDETTTDIDGEDNDTSDKETNDSEDTSAETGKSDGDKEDDTSKGEDDKKDPSIDDDKTPVTEKETDKESDKSEPTEKPEPIVTDVVGTWILTYDYSVASHVENGLEMDFTWTLTKDGKLTVKQNAVPSEKDAIGYCRDFIEKLYKEDMTDAEVEQFAIDQGYESADEYFDVLAEKLAEEMVESFEESPAEYSGSYTFDGANLTVDGTLKIKLKASNGKWIVESLSGELDGILIYVGAELDKQ